MNLLIMQFSPTSCHFISLRSKHSPQHPVLKHPQSIFLPYLLPCSQTPNPSSNTMALGSTQPLTEMSTRNVPGGKGWPAREADNVTAITDPIV
jgi:hypothetical protein